MVDRVDAVIVGAGLGGLYMLHKLREMGMTASVFGIRTTYSFSVLQLMVSGRKRAG